MKRALGIPEIEEILAVGDEKSPEPPESLLELLKEEIPEELGTDTPGRGSSGGRRPLYLIAATLFLAVFGAVVTYRVRDSLPQPVANDSTPGAQQVDEVKVQAKIESTPKEADRGLLTAGDAPDDAGRSVSIAAPSTPVARKPVKQRPAGRFDESVGAHEIDALETEKRTLSDSIPAQVEVPKVRDSSSAAVMTPRAPVAAEESVSSRVGYVGGDSAKTRPKMGVPHRQREVSPDGETGTFRGRASRGVDRRNEPTSAKDARRRLAGPSAAPPSTGGTSEPNDQPYGDMFFRAYGTNPFVDAEVDSLSTFGLDVDTGSYTLARSYIERGDLPPASAVRVEEFVNYFDYGDRPPRHGDFSIAAEGAPSP
ncbi:MAG: von Willebrand factor type A domain-containing protein, partial [Acidobacteriota bacterium]|nr:von Willebrand factor type A domain-containing protein [Acidobacteriota bacterium]